MQFQIPQFIEVEDKIAGPLTLRQTLFLLGAGGIAFIGYFLFQFWLWLIIAVIVGVMAISLAFLKYNGQPMIKIIFSALSFLWKPRLYLWQRETIEKVITLSEEDIAAKRKSLKDFSLEMPSVKKLWANLTTTKNPIPKREKRIPVKKIEQYDEFFDVFRKLTGEKEVVKRVDYR